MHKIWTRDGAEFAYRARINDTDNDPEITLERTADPVVAWSTVSWETCPPAEFCAEGLLWIKRLGEAITEIIGAVTTDDEAPPTDREPWSEPASQRDGLAVAFRRFDMGAIRDGVDAVDIYDSACALGSSPS